MSNFNDDYKQWALNNAINQLNSATSWLSKRISPPEILDLPSYYSGEETPAIVNSLENDSHKALELALNIFLPIDDELRNKSLTILQKIHYSWALNNKGATGWQAKLDLVNKGAGLIDAYQMVLPRLEGLTYYPETINEWIKGVYLPLAIEIRDGPWYKFFYRNNTNAWGWCGYLLAKKAIGEEITQKDVNKFSKFIHSQIGADGRMKKEVWRTNSGMWYSYFSLVPLTRCALLLANKYGMYLFYELMDAYSWYRRYCLKPETWPYRPWPWIFGKIERVLFPCADEVELPSFSGRWPSDLLETIYSLGYSQSWISEKLQCPIVGGALFRNSTALRTFNLTKQIYLD